MPYKEKESVRLFYTIGEVASMFGVNTSMIRYYEKEFGVIKPHKNKKGNRLFTQADVDHFTRIFSLIRDRGYSLAKAREAMAMPATPAKEESAQEQVIRRLKQVRSRLAELQAALDHQ
ncbi:MAG: MerR family transcriptional regulator [Bacteroidales bacterium]